MVHIDAAVFDKNREHQIIEIVQQIVKNSSLLLYTDLWSKAGFTVTRNYTIIEDAITPLKFSSIPIRRQLSNFGVVRNNSSSEEAIAWRLIDLLMPLLRTGRYYDYFDLWAKAGFHITPIPAPQDETSGFRPNLFLLGAAKCGTTTLHRYLGEIPSVCMSRPKEPFFFEAEYELGLEHYHRKYFGHWKGESILGDGRHRNLYIPYIAERIFAVNPQARLIICVRNPIERAYSHWWHWYSRQIESLEFRQAIIEDIERVQAGWLIKTHQEMDVYKQVLDSTGKGIYRSYLDSGYYYQQIFRYREYFPENQFKIILFEDLERDPYSSIKELETFIGTNYYRQDNFLPRKENIHSPESDTLKRSPISSKFRAFLRDHYREHNTNLAKFLDRDLSHWQ